MLHLVGLSTHRNMMHGAYNVKFLDIPFLRGSLRTMQCVLYDYFVTNRGLFLHIGQ